MIRKKTRITSKPFFFGGLVFFSIALFVAYVSFGSMLRDYVNTRSWVQVPAAIHSLELYESISEDEDGRRSVSYSVRAEYSYVVNGDEYTHTRVALSGGSDNIGPFWHDLYRDLTKKHERNKVYAWVDMDNPVYAVLDRTLRWRLVIFGFAFFAVFGMFGAIMIWVSLLPENSKEEFLENAKYGLASSESVSHKFIFLFGLLFFTFGAAAAAIVLPDALREGQYAALLVLIFAGVGAGVMYMAWRSKRLYQAIGKTLLFLDPVPGAIGGQIGGYLDVESCVSDGPLRVRVTCRAERRSGDETYQSILWQEVIQPYVKNRGDGARITFAVDVPSDLPEPEGWVNGLSIDWQVECDGKLLHGRKELTLSRSWNIPVEKSTRKSRAAAYVPREFAGISEATKLEIARESAEAQIDVSEAGGLVTLISASGRSFRLSTSMACVGFIFALIGGYTINNGWMPGYFFISLGGSVAILGLFLLGRKISVVIDPNERTAFMGRSWFSVPIYSRNIVYSDAENFLISSTSSMNTGKTMTAYYAVYIQRNGKKIKIAEGIKGKDAAQVLLDDLLARLF